MLAGEHPISTESDITGLKEYRFPARFNSVAHWKNFLLTACTSAVLLPHGLMHPAALFHIPIVGAGTSIAYIFALGQAESDLPIMCD
ncbi:MAG: hypothetical protein P8J79_10150 [Halioglobus sp.]|nr:hypothetical protein [Halioglobus sp.]